MNQKQTVIVICADEKANAGERAYTQALAIQVSAQQNPNVQYVFAKKPLQDAPENLRSVEIGWLPLTNSLYATMPTLGHLETQAALQEIIEQTADNPLTIIGSGHSTLQTTLALEQAAKDYGAVNINVGVVTHLLSPAEAEVCAKAGVQVFSTMKKQPDHPADLQLTTLSRVPDTNTPESQAINYQTFAATPNGQIIEGWQKSDQPMVGVVLNAGFDIDSVRQPYTDEEAYAQAYALGASLPEDTALFLAHGGPRNNGDEALGQNNTALFAAGYLAGQARKEADYNTAKSTIAQGDVPAHDLVVVEKFQQGLDYDAVKAMSHMVKTHDNLTLAVSNAEGYGTMDMMGKAAVETGKTVAMFNFNANQIQIARRENTDKYHSYGIALAEINDNKLEIVKHPNPQVPVGDLDPALVILQKLKLAA